MRRRGGLRESGRTWEPRMGQVVTGEDECGIGESPGRVRGLDTSLPVPQVKVSLLDVLPS